MGTILSLIIIHRRGWLRWTDGWEAGLRLLPLVYYYYSVSCMYVWTTVLALACVKLSSSLGSLNPVEVVGRPTDSAG